MQPKFQKHIAIVSLIKRTTFDSFRCCIEVFLGEVMYRINLYDTIAKRKMNTHVRFALHSILSYIGIIEHNQFDASELSLDTYFGGFYSISLFIPFLVVFIFFYYSFVHLCTIIIACHKSSKPKLTDCGRRNGNH